MWLPDALDNKSTSIVKHKRPGQVLQFQRTRLRNFVLGQEKRQAEQKGTKGGVTLRLPASIIKDGGLSSTT